MRFADIESGEAAGASFCSDPKYISIGLRDGSAALVNWRTDTAIWTQPVSRGPVHALAPFQDDQRLACGTADGTLVIVATDTDQTAQRRPGHSAAVRHVAVGGRLIASAGDAGDVLLWDTRARAAVDRVVVDDIITGLAVVDDGFMVSELAGILRRYDARAGAMVEDRLGESLQGFAMNSSAGHSVVTRTASGVVLLDMQHGDTTAKLPLPPAAVAPVVSVGGAAYITVGGEALLGVDASRLTAAPVGCRVGDGVALCGGRGVVGVVDGGRVRVGHV